MPRAFVSLRNLFCVSSLPFIRACKQRLCIYLFCHYLCLKWYGWKQIAEGAKISRTVLGRLWQSGPVCCVARAVHAKSSVHYKSAFAYQEDRRHINLSALVSASNGTISTDW